MFCRPLLLSIGTAAVLASCAAPSTRISTSLQQYGLDRDRASCVGDRLQANLSISQLQQLGRAARAVPPGTTRGSLTMGDLLRVAAKIGDPKVPFEVAKAAGNCGVLAGAPVVTPS